MKKINKVQFMVLILFIIIMGSCSNTPNNAISKLEQSSKSELTDTLINSKKSSILNVFEIFEDWLKLEQDQSVVVKNLGLPENQGKDEYWGATGTYVQNWNYVSAGIVLDMESDSLGGTKKILSITIIRPSKFMTSQGIGIGSTVKSVKEKYLQLIDSSSSNNKTIVVGSIYGGTIFTIENGLVCKMFVGAIAE